MKKLLTLALVFVAAFAVFNVATVAPALAAPKDDVCAGVELTGGNCDPPQNGTSVQSVITDVINILSFVVGVTAVIMIIIGGFKYITSGGDSGSVTGAKNTILYAIIGLVIVAVAQIIVRFVIRTATNPGNGLAN